MRFDLISGTGGVVRFPTERRAKPTLLGLRELAPREDLAAAMADERAETRNICAGWAGDEGAPDTLAEAAEAFGTLLKALEFGMGQEAALAHLRGLVATQVEQAHVLCWAYRDAEAAAKEAEATLRAARTSGAEAFTDAAANAPRFRELRDQVRRTRTVWTQQALVARAATDMALGAQAALDFHEHGTPWQRTGEDNGDWLPDRTTKTRERQDEPA